MTNFDLNLVWQNAANFSTLNTIILIGFTVLYGILFSILFIHGATMHIHEDYNTPKKKWYKTIQSVASFAQGLLGAYYMYLWFSGDVGSTQVSCTYIVSVVLASLFAVTIAGMYIVAYHCVILPVRFIYRLFKRK